MWKPDLTGAGSKYMNIADRLERDLRRGVVRPGERLPTHRELADSIGVNVSTITRAYKEAERRGLIAATVGRGTFIAADACAHLDLVRPEGIRSDLIELGLVLPLYERDGDLEDILKRMSRNRRLRDYTKYTDPAGLPEHRASGACWVGRFGFNVGPERILVTAGAQHAMACTLLACFKPGDRIAVDALTYPGFKSVAGMLGMRLTAVPADGEGMLPDALDAACRREEIKGIYLMPGVQNPTAIHMPAKRRERLAEEILRHGLLLLEDDVYGHTCPNRPPALSTLVPEKSIYIAGLSKILYAGLRAAYVVAADPYRNYLVRAILNTIWMAPPLNAAIIAECIDTGLMNTMLSVKMKEAAARNALAAEKLHGFEYRGLSAGYFIWLQLPEPWTGQELESRARLLGLNLFSAEKFAVGGIAAPAAVRISLTGPESRDDLARGLDVLARLLAEHYEPTPIL